MRRVRLTPCAVLKRSRRPVRRARSRWSRRLVRRAWPRLGRRTARPARPGGRYLRASSPSCSSPSAWSRAPTAG
eukprot:8317455-Alexandrium_andersonii.AAC.1